MKKQYSSKVALTRNSRGVYCLDPSMGCSSGMSNESGGCYNDCYAVKASKQYGFNFSKTVLRNFTDETHRRFIVNQIDRIKLDFVRMGCSGDPSEDWEHTIKILKAIDKCNKEIVIITKHWTNLTQNQMEYLATINVCVNTSVSALDKEHILSNSLEQYNKLKCYCKSILRIVSADFNLQNETGYKLAQKQKELFENDDTLDTVLRVSKNNRWVKSEIVRIAPITFMGKKQLGSKHKKSIYLGKCDSCFQMCGQAMKPNNQIYPVKPGLTKQLSLFTIKTKAHENS